jgi:hypothetical protein
MNSTAQRSPINFSSSFGKSVSEYQALSESKKNDIQLRKRLEQLSHPKKSDDDK